MTSVTEMTRMGWWSASTTKMRCARVAARRPIAKPTVSLSWQVNVGARVCVESKPCARQGDRERSVKTHIEGGLWGLAATLSSIWRMRFKKSMMGRCSDSRFRR